MRSLAGMAPALTQGKEPAAACCMRPCPPDGLPIMGRVPGTANAFIAAGHNCWGILGAVRTPRVRSGSLLLGRKFRSSSLSCDLPLVIPTLIHAHKHTRTQPATGLVMAELVAGEEPSVALDAFDPRRFMQNASRRGKKIRGVEVGEQW